jgi:hypothetical protein
MTTETPTQVTQTEVFALQGGYQNTYDREVRSISVTDGKLFVSANDEDFTLKDGSTATFDNASAIFVSVPGGCHANGSIVYADNAVMPVFQNATALPQELHHDAAVRGDADSEDGKQTGSFESRTVAQLRDLARERGVEVTGKKGKEPAKADFIKALRA